MTATNGEFKNGTCPYLDSPQLRELRDTMEILNETLKSEFHELVNAATGKDRVPLKTHYWTVLVLIAGFVGVELIKHFLRA